MIEDRDEEIDGFGLAGHFRYHLRYISSQFAFAVSKSSHFAEIEQALSPFITGYIGRSCRIKRISKELKKRRENRTNHSSNLKCWLLSIRSYYNDDWTTYGITMTFSLCVSCLHRLINQYQYKYLQGSPLRANPTSLPSYITLQLPLRLTWFF